MQTFKFRRISRVRGNGITVPSVCTLEAALKFGSTESPHCVYNVTSDRDNNLRKNKCLVNNIAYSVVFFRSLSRIAGIAAATMVISYGLTGDSLAQAAPVTEPAGINLGDTSFNDGFSRLSPGWVYQQYFQISHFNAITGADGNVIPASKNMNVNAIASINQLVYVTPYRLLGGSLGATALLPFVDLAANPENPSLNLKANGFGIGDLTWGVFLQMPPIISGGRPIFTDRFEFDVISPIGKYNKNKDINQSSGYWSIAPYYAFTILPAPRCELSARLNYLYNFSNNTPASGSPISPRTYTRAGQAVWINFATSYVAIHGLDVGINGYYFKQFTNDRVDGFAQPNSKVTNLSIGPGISYEPYKSTLFFINDYFPIVEKNTFSGFQLVFRYVHAF